ncbi:MAG: hypothetical protein V4508_24890 [Pseudomonadota bacterium]
MKKLFPMALCGAFSLTLFGCAAPPAARDEAMLTFETKPAGAVLYEGKLAIGTAPVTRTYKTNGKSSTITTPEVTAVWASGAKTSFWTYVEAGADRVAVLERPAGAPNIEKDLAVAGEISAAKAEKEKNEARETTHEMTRNSAKCMTQRSKGSASGDCA